MFVVVRGKFLSPEDPTGLGLVERQGVAEIGYQQPPAVEANGQNWAITGRIIALDPHGRAGSGVEGDDAGARAAHRQEDLAVLDQRRGRVAELRALPPKLLDYVQRPERATGLSVHATDQPGWRGEVNP